MLRNQPPSSTASSRISATGDGRVVNIVSVGGKIAMPHLLAYSASKFALAGFSEGLAAEVRASGVKVTTVYPGLMRTGSPRNALFKGQHRAEYAWFSIADALPSLAMDVSRAAHRIVNACARGELSLVLTLPARAAVAVHARLPNATIRLLSLVNRLLPGSDGGTTRRPGAGQRVGLVPLHPHPTGRARGANPEPGVTRLTTRGARR
jgi:short-subunit dehydrogenase